MPKVELEPYDGDSLKYHSFFAVFDENVEKICSSGSAKLTRLLQYTVGDAKEAIRACSLIGGEDGYEKARAILQKRYGNDHIISNKLITTLRKGPFVKTAEDLQKLSDELVTGQSILTRMEKLSEMDTQTSILDIVNRLQPYLRAKWRTFAMEKKRQCDGYPQFRDFVEFIMRESDEANDPVYGQAHYSTKMSNKSDNVSKSDKLHRFEKIPNKVSFNAVKTKNEERKIVQACIVCGENHRLFLL